MLELDKSFNGENLFTSERIWIENAETIENYITSPRIGINYAGEPWISKPWRFFYESKKVILFPNDKPVINPKQNNS